MRKKIISSVVLAFAGSLLVGGAALAQEYPIAGNAPSTLGQSILPVNKAGAAGVTGSNFVINAKKDMNKTIPYKWDDFTVIGMTELNPFILTVSPDSPYETFADFEKAVKDGVELTYSSAGVGTLLHIATAVMADAMGADPDKLTHVPYKGGGKARTAVVSGAVDFSWGNLSASAGALEAGQLRALAVTTEERFATIPDVPTASEVGYPDLEQIIGWSAIYGPPGLPDDVVATWTDTLNQLNDNAAWLKLTKGLGNIVSIMGPEETKAFVEKQYNVFDAAIEKLGMRIE